MLGYALALIPIYFFVYLPISQTIYGTTQKTSDVGIANFNFNVSLIASNEPLSCTPHGYNTHILSMEPLIIYIEKFLSADECSHLLKISEGKFEPATVSTAGDTSINKDVRFSEVAIIDRDDVVRCIEHRARDFQGWNPDLHIERLRTQRYGVGGHYKHHYDWSGASREADRVSTFMVYVDAQCEGGGTEFPRIRVPDVKKGRWCEFLECSNLVDESPKGPNTGVIFKPITGNAIFWQNLAANGRGYEDTYHAGLPVLSGTKVGLNIWSWGSARKR